MVHTERLTEEPTIGKQATFTDEGEPNGRKESQ